MPVDEAQLLEESWAQPFAPPLRSPRAHVSASVEGAPPTCEYGVQHLALVGVGPPDHKFAVPQNWHVPSFEYLPAPHASLTREPSQP